MKKFYLNLKLLLLLMFSVISLNINAHDFEAVNGDGKTIFYRIISETNLTVSVTYRGNSYDDYYNEYIGMYTLLTEFRNKMVHNNLEKKDIKEKKSKNN